MIRANQLDFSGDEIEEGMSYYDEESLSLCGIEDFYRSLPPIVSLCSSAKSGGASVLRRALHRRYISCVVNFTHLFPQLVSDDPALFFG